MRFGRPLPLVSRIRNTRSSLPAAHNKAPVSRWGSPRGTTHRRLRAAQAGGRSSIRGRATRMNFEKYTERARGFVQAAQNLAVREGNPQLAPGHLLKVLLDDPEGLCAGLIDRAGGQSRVAHAQV